MCTRGADAARYVSRRLEIALRVETTLEVLRCPVAYLDQSISCALSKYIYIYIYMNAELR
jgi:hypothetical protein